MLNPLSLNPMPQDNLSVFNEFVEKHLKRNFWLNIGDGVCFFVSMTFISMETIVPVLVSRLGGNSLVGSLVPFFMTATMGLGPFLIARDVQQLDMKRPSVVFWGAAMRLPLLVIGALILALGAGHDRGLLFSVIIGLILYFLFGAVSVNPYFDLVAKVIPEWVPSTEVQWAILGKGEPEYHELFSELAQKFPKQVAVRLEFSDPLAHRIEAGSDLFQQRR